MIEIKSLVELDFADLEHLIIGYVSNAKYRVSKIEAADRFILSLELVALSQPFIKHYDHLDTATLEYYTNVPQLGFSFGAFETERCVGIALAEPRQWNQSLWVWEFHVAETHRRRGVGRQMMEAVSTHARAAGLRSIVCETQNTNVPAIRFYQAVGFQIEGVDISYYSNADFPDGEIALFMKRRLV